MVRIRDILWVMVVAFVGFFLHSNVSRLAAASITVNIHPQQVRNTIDKGIYSQFLEHIYHSADNGLWGEMIWNRSFEEPKHLPGGGQWVRTGNDIRQMSLAANVRKAVGLSTWNHYQVSLDAEKLGGSEGFMIYFYSHDAGHWFDLNLGGWGDTQDALQRAGGRLGLAVVASKPTMRIRRGKWYNIRLKCDGPHIQAWVNGKHLFDQTVKHGLFSGAIGLGTWHTRAAYKHLLVKSLTDGRVLYSGLPAGEKKWRFATRFWTSYGPGTARRSRADPRNSHVCVEISPTNGETGVQQPDICLPSADIYNGSLWVRDASPHAMAIRLVDGPTVLGQKDVHVTSAAWKRIGFSFRTTTPVHHATLQIGFTGKGNVYLDQVSMMSAAARKLGGFRPDTLKAVEALKPGMIRWPGGGYSNGYHWMDGIGPQADRISEGEMWDDMDPNSLGTDEYIRMCRLTGAKPEICINIGPSDANASLREQYVREACHWLEYCNEPASNKWGALRAKYGHPKPYNVKYWEIGNEVWYSQDGLKAKKYAGILRQFVAAMKGVDPSIRIVACGSGGLDQTWNQQLLKYGSESFDYLSLHQYVPPQGFLTDAKQYLAFTRKTGQLIKASANPHCKIFVSEWNAQSIDWRTGLFAGGILIGFERQGAIVRLSTPALFLRWVRASDWNNSLINFSRCSWFPAPNYVVEKLWRDNYAKYRIATTPAGPLEADATLSADHKTAYYKAVNPTGQPIELKLAMGPGFRLAAASARTVTSGSLLAENTMRHPNRIAAHRLTAGVSGQNVDLRLAPYSATVVTMRSK